MFNLFRLFYGEKSDDLLSQAMRDSKEMFRKSRIMFEAASDSLLEKKEMPFDIFEKDQELNEMLKKLRRKLVIYLSNPKGSPRDTIAPLIVSIITVDIERIGDYAKNISELSRLYHRRLEGKHADSLREINKEILKMFTISLEAIEIFSDVEARTAMEMLPSITGRCEEMFDSLAKERLGGAKTTTIALLARFLKRTACHVANITSSIVNPYDRIGYSYEDKKEK